jgi:hypothetical protein
MYLQKVISRKTVKKIFFVGTLKDTDEKCRVWIRTRILKSVVHIISADPDPVVRGKNPRIRIRTKM